MELQRRNFLIFATLLVLVGIAASATLFVGHRAKADDQSSLGVYDVQVDRHHEWVDVIFDKAIDVARPGEIVDPAPATIEPAITGVWRWRAPNVLRFTPAGGFAPGSNYRIALKTPRLLAAGQRFRGDGEVKVAIARLLIEDITAAEEPSASDPRLVVLHGDVRFNDAVDPQVLVTRMAVIDGDQRLPVEILADGGRNDVISFRTPPLPKGRNERTVRIVVDKSVADVIRGVAMDRDFVKDVAIGSNEKLTVRRIDVFSGAEESTIKVELSSAVNPNIAAKFVTVKPAAKFHLSAEGNELLIAGAFEPGSTVSLNIGHGLPAIDNATLAADYTTTVMFPDLQAKLDFQSEGMFLSSSGFKTVAIESINVSEATLGIDRVYRNNIFPLLVNDYWYPMRYRYEADDDDDDADASITAVSHTLGDPILRKKIPLRRAHNKKVVTTVSLEPYVNKREPGLYRVVLQGGDHSASRWILITDLGIVAKRSNDSVLVWVSSFKDLSAVGDASVSLISDQNQTLASGHTDARGLVSLAIPKKKSPFMLTVQRGRDFSFLMFRQSEVDLSPFDVAGATLGESGYTAFAYGERDIYRLGESVEGVAVVRDRALQPPPQMPIVAKHYDGDDLRESLRLTIGDGGTAPFTIKLPPYARTGHHRVDFVAGKDVIGSYFFQVEEFVPDRIKVEITPKTKNAAPGEDLVYDVTSAYLFGPPAANLAYESRVRIVPSVFTPKGFESYRFENDDRKFDARELTSESGSLDAHGLAELKTAIPPRMTVASSLDAIVTARVQEQGGRGVSAVAHVPVHPWPVYLGIRKRDDGYPPVGQPVTFDWVAVAKDGTPAKSGTLRAELIEDDWHTVLRRTQNGGYDYESTRDSRTLSVKPIAAGATRGSFTFTATSYRSYRVVLSDPQSGASTETSFYAGGWGYSPWAMKNPGRLQLELDKRDYAPGDVATLQVKAPFAGKLLVTVERDEVAYTSVATMTGNAATIKVPLTAGMRPNAFITATLVRAAKDLEPGEAGRAFGAVAVNVDREASHLHPSIAAPAEIRSHRKLPVEVKAEPGATVTIAAVDEGILQLIAQKTPDPFAHFYRRLALGIATHDIFAQLLPEVRPKGRANVGGSESMEGAAQYIRADSIRRAKPVAYWSGTLKANADGVARFTFDIPDFNGGIRIMTVVHHGRRFGSAESMVRVHDPLVLTVTAPRFLAVNDAASLPVTVRNDTGRSGRFAVNRTTLDLANGTEKTIYLPLRAPATPQELTIDVNASGNGEKASASVTIPVRWGQPIESVDSGGAIMQPVAVFGDDAKAFVPASVERTLVISSVPLVRFRGKLTYLLHYPYGCVEQTTSSVFPLVYFGDVAKELDPDAFAKDDSAAMIREGVRRLGTMQTVSGGFAMWPYGASPYPWGTTYATHFLVEARRAGHQVEPAIYDGALAYLASDAKARSDYDSSTLERVVYDLYVLARAGKPDVGTMDYIREHQLDRLSPSTKAMLAAAYAASGNPKMIESLLAGVTDADAIARQSGGNLDSVVRNRALLLIALLDGAPSDPRIPRIVERLTRDATDSWWSTQESSFVLLALGQFYRRQHATASYSGSVYAGNQLVGTFTAKTALFRDIRGSAPLRVKMNPGYTAGAAWFDVVTRGVKTPAAARAETAGIQVTRELLTRDGKALDPAGVKQGDLIVSVTRVTSTNGQLDNVVVQNRIPAGLEVENPRLKTTETFTWITGSMSECTSSDIRDDQVLYFVELPTSGTLTYYTLLRAVTPGVFTQPGAYAEAMYTRANHGCSERGTLVVRTK